MNTPRVENQRASTSVRSPIIVNQLGPDIRAALVDHWSRPLIIDHSADRAPWEVAPEADVLLTRPLVGWHKAPAEKPAGWPFGLHWIQTASTGVDLSFRRGCSTVPWSRSAAASRLIRSRNTSLRRFSASRSASMTSGRAAASSGRSVRWARSPARRSGLPVSARSAAQSPSGPSRSVSTSGFSGARPGHMSFRASSRLIASRNWSRFPIISSLLCRRRPRPRV
ncbi:hypothetical protein ACVWZ3_002420 [Bradyrhizobium sp. i1.3.6]